MNKSDGQVESMGLDRATLDQINKKAILLNVQARRGENLKSESGMWPGYDPALQVFTLKSRIIVKVLIILFLIDKNGDPFSLMYLSFLLVRTSSHPSTAHLDKTTVTHYLFIVNNLSI